MSALDGEFGLKGHQNVVLDGRIGRQKVVLDGRIGLQGRRKVVLDGKIGLQCAMVRMWVWVTPKERKPGKAQCRIAKPHWKFIL